MASKFAYIQPAIGATIYFSLIISETHTNHSELTAHPVEVGSDVNDNVRHEPETIELEGFVTNTPIMGVTFPGDPDQPIHLANVHLDVATYTAPPISFTALLTAGLSLLGDLLFGPPVFIGQLQQFTPKDNIKTVHNALTAIERSGQLCSIITSTKQYDNMILTDVSLPRDKLGGATFKVSAKRLNVVSTSTSSAPKPLIQAGKAPAAAGAQTPTEAPAPLKSVAGAIVDKVFGQ